MHLFFFFEQLDAFICVSGTPTWVRPFEVDGQDCFGILLSTFVFIFNTSLLDFFFNLNAAIISQTVHIHPQYTKYTIFVHSPVCKECSNQHLISCESFGSSVLVVNGTLLKLHYYYYYYYYYYYCVV